MRRFFALLSYCSGLEAIRKRYSRLISGPSLTVLCYHRVSDLASDKSLHTVSTVQFERQIKYIKERFNVITFSEAIKMKANPKDHADSLIISFDDGYQDNFTNAVPILNKYGLKACFFPILDLIDIASSTKSSYQADTFSSSGMTWDEVKSLRDMGFELGAHTCSHPNLAKIPFKEALREISQSKEKMESKLGLPIEYFAYPGGKKGVHYDDAVKSIVEKEFRLCCTTTRGRNSFRTMDIHNIHRICIQNWWSIFYFARELEGLFNFVGRHRFIIRKLISF